MCDAEDQPSRLNSGKRIPGHVNSTYQHFNTLIWQVPSIGIAIASAILYAAHELALNHSKSPTNWLVKTGGMQVFLLAFGTIVLFIMSLTLYRYRHFQTWAAPVEAPSPPFRRSPKANQWLQMIMCLLTGILFGLALLQQFKEIYLLGFGLASGIVFWIIIEFNWQEIESEIIGGEQKSIKHPESQQVSALVKGEILSKSLLIVLSLFAFLYGIGSVKSEIGNFFWPDENRGIAHLAKVYDGNPRTRCFGGHDVNNEDAQFKALLKLISANAALPTHKAVRCIESNNLLGDVTSSERFQGRRLFPIILIKFGEGNDDFISVGTLKELEGWQRAIEEDCVYKLMAIIFLAATAMSLPVLYVKRKEDHD